jgi:hypothetical protein
MTVEAVGGELGEREGQDDRPHGEHPVGGPEPSQTRVAPRGRELRSGDGHASTVRGGA